MTNTALVINAPSKQCTACMSVFPATLDYFHKSKYADGFTAKCKSCRSTQRKKHYSKNKDRLLMQSREYYAANKLECRKRSEDWKRRNAEKYKSLVSAWKANNKDKVWSTKTRRRELEKSEFVVTAKDMLRLKNSVCATCGSQDQIEIDHIIPLSRGGKHSIGNLQPLCRFHNRSKGSKFVSELKYG